MSNPRETRLYAPVKAYLEAQGYSVKGEIAAADIVALRGNEPPLIVELKNGFSLVLLQQAAARQAITDTVYVALPRWSGKAGWRAFKGNIGLCKRLGIGVISVREADGVVQVHADPAPFQPRKSKARKAALLKEFAAREGDPTMGGTNGQVMTAYRQDARRIAAYLATAGPSKGADVARATGVSRATRIMADNHYGWFFRAARGIYTLSDAGEL
jgi:hypothetical protein